MKHHMKCKFMFIRKACILKQWKWGVMDGIKDKSQNTMHGHYYWKSTSLGFHDTYVIWFIHLQWSYIVDDIGFTTQNSTDQIDLRNILIEMKTSCAIILIYTIKAKLTISTILNLGDAKTYIDSIYIPLSYKLSFVEYFAEIRESSVVYNSWRIM